MKIKIPKTTITIILTIFEIFLGIYIANITEIYSTKKTEQIQLKAKVVEQKIEVVTDIISMVQEPILTFKTNKSDLAQSLYGYEGCDNCCCAILEDYTTFGDWATQFHKITSENRFLFNDDINLYITQIYLYNQKLNEIFLYVPADVVWQVGVVLHSEMTHLYQTLSQLLEEYLSDDIYDLEFSTVDSYDRVIKLSPQLNIVKYEKQIIEYFGKRY